MAIVIKGKEYTEEQAQAIIEFAQGQKNDPSGTTPTATPLHGAYPGNANQFGIFSEPGVAPGRYSAIAQPYSLAEALGAPVPNPYATEIFQIVTGVTRNTVNNADNWCDYPPTPGQLKACKQLINFGKWSAMTKIEAIPEIGKLRNRADIPGQILNFGPRQNPMIPDFLGSTIGNTRSALEIEVFEMYNQFAPDFETVLVQGEAGEDNSRYGWWQEFAGLDSWIKTGYVNAGTNVLCPAVDSIVYNYNAALNADNAAGQNIVEVVSSMHYALTDRAQRMGFRGLRVGIMMPSQAFWQLTFSWAENYATNRFVTAAAGTPLLQNAMELTRMQQDMYNNQYLMINGIRVEVIFSDGIATNSVGNNVFNTTIYFVPLSYEGGRLTYLEYFPMTAPGNPFASEFANANGPHYAFLNDGMYIMGSNHRNFCQELLFAMQLRLIMRTPFLAARLDNVRYTNIDGLRSAYPSDSFNFANGGPTYLS